MRLLLFFILLSSSVFSQEKITYKSQGLYCHYCNPLNDSIISTLAIGKNVKVVHDLFFKSWRITFIDENDTPQNIRLKYISTDTKGTEKTIDDQGIVWYVVN